MCALKKKTRYHWGFLAFHCVPIWIQLCNFHSALSALALGGISVWVKTGAAGPLTAGLFLPQGALGRWGTVVVFLRTWRHKCTHLFRLTPVMFISGPGFFQTSLKAASLKQSWVCACVFCSTTFSLPEAQITGFFFCLFFAVWDTRLFKAHALKLNTISSADGVNNKNVEGNRAGEIACDYYLRAGWSIYWRGSSASKHIQIREADVTELLSLLNVLLPSELPSSPGVTALWPVCTRDTGPGFPSGNIWSRWGDRKELPFFLRNTLSAIHVFLKSVWFLATWAMRLSNYRYLRHTEITLPAEMNAAIKAIGITLATAAKKHW